MQRAVVFFLSSLVLVAFLAGCNGFTASDAELQRPIDAFLKAASTADTDTAWRWASDELKQAETKDQLASGIRQQPYLFQEFKSVTIQQKTFVASTAGPTIAQVGGVLTYTDNSQATFSARLVKQNDGWKVSNVNITVDATRIKKFLQGS